MKRRMKKSVGEKVFEGFNYTFLTILALSCILPFIHIAALSLSSAAASVQGIVGLWPVDFTTFAYYFAFSRTGLIRSIGISVWRVGLGVPISLLLTVLAAYPLSKTNKELPGRTAISWFFIATMFFSAGLIPFFLVVNATGLRNSMWALVIPGSVWAFNLAIMLNVFRQIPRDYEESALMEGASQFRVLWQIYIPLSKATLAALTLFIAVGHWNEWFHGMIFIDHRMNQPMQTYLRGNLILPDFTLLNPDQFALFLQFNVRTFHAAQIIIGTIPILLVYPFLQRYFVKGMALGGLKG